MFLNDSLKEKNFVLPEDHEVALSELLQCFDGDNIKEIYIKSYGITNTDLVNKIKQADSRGIPVNILSDYVQSRGSTAWEICKDLQENLKHGSIILTTAGCNSPIPSAIFHAKALTVVKDDQDRINWEGSVNFSSNGMSQCNTARKFTGKIWSDIFIDHFNKHKDWALHNRQDKQIKILMEQNIEALSIDDLDESHVELMDEIAKLKDEANDLKNSNENINKFAYSMFWLSLVITVLNLLFWFLK